jgi:thiol-disulfide isomerase/thioredoxin
MTRNRPFRSGPPGPGAPGAARRRWIAEAGSLALAAAAAGWPARAHAAHQLLQWPATRPTPALKLVDLDGAAWSNESLLGRPVLLNFWASWCEPCRTEMPSLELLQTRHERDGLVVLAVNYRETAPAIRRFLAVQPVSLPVLPDADGSTSSAWTPRVFPTTVAVDRSGRPRVQVIGGLDWLGPEAHAIVAPLLARPRSA